jgi:hypothetical protein
MKTIFYSKDVTECKLDLKKRLENTATRCFQGFLIGFLKLLMHLLCWYLSLEIGEVRCAVLLTRNGVGKSANELGPFYQLAGATSRYMPQT